MVDVTEFGVRNVEEAVKKLRGQLDKGWTEREVGLAEAIAASVKDELDRREAKVLAEIAALHKALDDSLGQVKALLKALPAPQVQVKNIIPEAPPADVVVHNHVPEQKAPDVNVTVPPRGPVTKSFEYDDYGRPSRIHEVEVGG